MSLFKTREFWFTEFDVDEKFDQNSLLITKLNNQADLIFVGSHAGILRIYDPSIETINNVLSSYKPTDLILEKLFDIPILNLGVGRLVSGSKIKQLAVLHPRSVAIYSLIFKEGLTEFGSQSSLKIIYKHKLKRSAANFTIGPFGGSQNRDFLCVQSVDGIVFFYEQETFSFCCFLPDFLLPEPLIYLKSTDSFITCNSNWCIESYKYKHLSERSQTNEDDSSGTRVTKDWSYNLGENVLDIKTIHNEETKESFILILGERNYFCLNQSGKLRFMKRLDYAPVTFHVYHLEGRIMSLVVSDTSTLLIYQETSLKWSTQLLFIPIAISRAFLKNIQGALCLLSEDGRFQLSYLGTRPNLFTAPPLVSKDLDFETVEQELNTLNRMIKSTFANDIKLTNENAERELVVTISINPHLEVIEETSMKKCEIAVEVLPQALFEEVQLSLFVQKPMEVFPETMFYTSLSDRAKFFCYVQNKGSKVGSLEFQVKASFISSLGIPRVINKVAILPLNLVMETCPPLKDGDFKITLNINKESIPLSTLFPEFIGENSLTLNSNAVGFKHLNSSNVVTILLAKSSQRYRIQSDSLNTMPIIIKEIKRRLEHYHFGSKEFSVSFTSTVPHQKLVECTRKHFNARRDVVMLEEELNILGAQLRLIQKRLIAKFKDKNPTPLVKLDLLLTDTYAQINDVTQKLLDAKEILKSSRVELSCALNFVVTLLELMDLKEFITFESIFSPHVFDLEKQNWEDVFDSGLCYALRTSLAKSEKDKLRASQTSFDEIKDISKLEKHVITVLERISKRSSIGEDKGKLDENNEMEKVDEIKEHYLPPIGIRLGESSTRVLSAKKVVR